MSLTNKAIIFPHTNVYKSTQILDKTETNHQTRNILTTIF